MRTRATFRKRTTGITKAKITTYVRGWVTASAWCIAAVNVIYNVVLLYVRQVHLSDGERVCVDAGPQGLRVRVYRGWLRSRRSTVQRGRDAVG